MNPQQLFKRALSRSISDQRKRRGDDDKHDATVSTRNYDDLAETELLNSFAADFAMANGISIDNIDMDNMDPAILETLALDLDAADAFASLGGSKGNSLKDVGSKSSPDLVPEHAGNADDDLQLTPREEAPSSNMYSKAAISSSQAGTRTGEMMPPPQGFITRNSNTFPIPAEEARLSTGIASSFSFSSAPLVAPAVFDNRSRSEDNSSNIPEFGSGKSTDTLSTRGPWGLAESNSSNKTDFGSRISNVSGVSGKLSTKEVHPTPWELGPSGSSNITDFGSFRSASLSTTGITPSGPVTSAMQQQWSQHTASSGQSSGHWGKMNSNGSFETESNIIPRAESNSGKYSNISREEEEEEQQQQSNLTKNNVLEHERQLNEMLASHLYEQQQQQQLQPEQQVVKGPVLQPHHRFGLAHELPSHFAHPRYDNPDQPQPQAQPPPQPPPHEASANKQQQSQQSYGHYQQQFMEQYMEQAARQVHHHHYPPPPPPPQQQQQYLQQQQQYNNNSNYVSSTNASESGSSAATSGALFTYSQLISAGGGGNIHYGTLYDTTGATLNGQQDQQEKQYQHPQQQYQFNPQQYYSMNHNSNPSSFYNENGMFQSSSSSGKTVHGDESFQQAQVQSHSTSSTPRFSRSSRITNKNKPKRASSYDDNESILSSVSSMSNGTEMMANMWSGVGSPKNGAILGEGLTAIDTQTAVHRRGAIGAPHMADSSGFQTSSMDSATATVAAAENSNSIFLGGGNRGSNSNNNNNNSNSSNSNNNHSSALRGSYACGRCGKPKVNHICEFVDTTQFSIQCQTTMAPKLKDLSTMTPFPGELVLTVSKRKSIFEPLRTNSENNTGIRVLSSAALAETNAAIKGAASESRGEIGTAAEVDKDIGSSGGGDSVVLSSVLFPRIPSFPTDYPTTNVCGSTDCGSTASSSAPSSAPSSRPQTPPVHIKELEFADKMGEEEL